jgi:hypothetical protein
LFLERGLNVGKGDPKKTGCPERKEEFWSGIPTQSALNMTPKGIMAETTLTSKNTETQHLKFLDIVYRDFLITMLGWAFGLVYGIKKAPGSDTKGYKKIRLRRSYL